MQFASPTPDVVRINIHDLERFSEIIPEDLKGESWVTKLSNKVIMNISSRGIGRCDESQCSSKHMPTMFFVTIVLVFALRNVFFHTSSLVVDEKSPRHYVEGNLGVDQEEHENVFIHTSSFVKDDKLPSSLRHYVERDLGVDQNEYDALSVVISYAFYYPTTKQKKVEQCLENINFFIESISQTGGIDYVFTMIGNKTKVPRALSKKAGLKNVHIRNSPMVPVDLFIHGEVINNYLDTKSHFIFLNCGARGPYFTERSTSTHAASRNWIHYWLSKLTDKVKAAGSTISCEVTPHIQTYALAVDKDAAFILKDLWYYGIDRRTDNKSTLVDDLEVGASTALLKAGYDITSLDSRYRGSFLHGVNSPCKYVGLKSRRDGIHLNPTACHAVGDTGCMGTEPCEVLFVKYGGEVMRRGLTPKPTINAMKRYDIENGCPAPIIHEFRPPWNPGSILENEFLRNSVLAEDMAIRENTEIVVLIRVFSGNALGVVSILSTLMIVPDIQFSVIILPTDFGAYQTVVAILKGHNFLDISFQVIVVNVPENIFVRYGNLLSKLCTKRLQSESILFEMVPAKMVERHCSVNSPLHYLLVDMILSHVTSTCHSCKLLVTTNADNSYAPNFFTAMKPKWDTHDVIMSNMVNKGRLLYVRPARRKVDLGAFAVSVPFLRAHNIFFLNSLPVRSNAADYHDADGLFIEALTSKNATVYINPLFNFFHN